MNREISNEMRAKIFAAHLGSEYYNVKRSWNGIVTPEVLAMLVDVWSLGMTDRHQLLLTPLSEITDEHAVEVARIILSKDKDWKPLEILEWDWCKRIITNREPDIIDKDTTVEMHVSIVYKSKGEPIRWVWDYIKANGTGIGKKSCPNIIHAIDYLRSKSYHVPYMGIDLFEVGIAQRKAA